MSFANLFLMSSAGRSNICWPPKELNAKWTFLLPGLVAPTSPTATIHLSFDDLGKTRGCWCGHVLTHNGTTILSYSPPHRERRSGHASSRMNCKTQMLRDTSQASRSYGPNVPPLLRGTIVAVSYFLFAKVSLTLASLHPSASPVWPPSGLALASLLLWGNGLWPAVAAGAFLANAMTFGSLSTSSLIATGNTLEALITAALLKHLKASTQLFEDPPKVVLFACLTLLPGTMISATMGVGSLALAGLADSAKFPSIWLTWWLGDVGGKLLVTPFFVLWAKSDLNDMTRVELQRLALLLGA